MIVRHATDADVEGVLAMGRAFLAESPVYAQFPVDEGTFVRAVPTVMAHGVVLVAEVPTPPARLVGFLAIMPVVHQLFGFDYGEEVAWWVAPAHRTTGTGEALLAHGEAWVQAQELRYFKTAAPAGTRLGRYYARRGYQELETVYQKELRG